MCVCGGGWGGVGGGVYTCIVYVSVCECLMGELYSLFSPSKVTSMMGGHGLSRAWEWVGQSSL